MLYLTDTQKIIKKARRIVKSPSLDFLVAPAENTPAMVIVVTPGKIGNAVQRNRVRRRIKALLHEHQISQKGWHTVAFIKKEGIGLSYEQLTSLIIPALNNHISKTLQ